MDPSPAEEGVLGGDKLIRSSDGRFVQMPSSNTELATRAATKTRKNVYRARKRFQEILALHPRKFAEWVPENQGDLMLKGMICLASGHAWNGETGELEVLDLDPDTRLRAANAVLDRVEGKPRAQPDTPEIEATTLHVIVDQRQAAPPPLAEEIESEGIVETPAGLE